MAAPTIDQHIPQATEQFSTQEIAQFARDGYFIVRGLADSVLCETMRSVTLDQLGEPVGPVEFEADLNYPGAPSSRDAVGGRTVRRLLRAHTRHPAFTDWLTCPELVNRLRQLLGPPIAMPLAHHNCIMTKHPRFSSETGWHRDIRYWSFERPELVSVWLALGSETLENGCLKLIPGSHRREFSQERFDEADFFQENQPEDQQQGESTVTAELQRGDVLFFHCRTLHSAGANQSSDTKFSAVFTFRAADNPPIPGTRSASLPELLYAPPPAES